MPSSVTRGQSDPVGTVRRYLEAMTARRLQEAGEILSTNAELVFPEGRFQSVQDLIASAARRYRWCRKVYEAWEVVDRGDGSATVYSTGTLYGENLYGVPFEGIRYIDRFVVRDGKIISQHVWNDLAESGVLTRTHK